MIPNLDFLRLSSTSSLAGFMPTDPAYQQVGMPHLLGKKHPWQPFGDDNLYPQHLIRFRSYSPTHAAILKLKHDLLIGEGFLNLPLNQSLISPNLLHHIGQDYVLFGGFALEVIWSRDGTKPAALRHLPFSQLRLSQPNEATQNPDHVYLSRDWQAYQQHQTPDYKPIMIPLFDPEAAKRQPRQVWYYADYCPEWPHYPIAPYQAALPEVVWDYEYSQFKTANMQNGMFPALHISVDSEPTEDERQQFYRELKRKFSGAAQAGEVLITYGMNGSGKVSIAPIEVRGNADLYKAWATDTTQRIITAHRLSSPVLAGLPGHGSLGGRGNEISVAAEHFFNTVIRPMQLTILQQLMHLAQFAGLTVNDLDISNSKPIRLVFEEDLLAKLLTIDELRQELGYEPRLSGINDKAGHQPTVAESLLRHQTDQDTNPPQGHDTALHKGSSSTKSPRLTSDHSLAQ